MKNNRIRNIKNSGIFPVLFKYNHFKHVFLGLYWVHNGFVSGSKWV